MKTLIEKIYVENEGFHHEEDFKVIGAKEDIAALDAGFLDMLHEAMETGNPIYTDSLRKITIVKCGACERKKEGITGIVYARDFDKFIADAYAQKMYESGESGEYGEDYVPPLADIRYYVRPIRGR